MKKILTLLIFSLALVSCEKFLDINPNDRAYQNDLLKDRKGFEIAMAGVYSELISNSLFGKEMRYGFLETLVGSYTSPSGTSHPYYYAYRHDYMHKTTRTTIDAMWNQMYRSVNELNIVLQDIDVIKDDPYYPIIKGEALGLRAFCHFELLKLFGPVIKQEGLQANAIPYRDQLSYTATKFSTAEEVISAINKDLEAAKNLLTADPIRTSGPIADLNSFDYEQYNSLIDRRVTRMNYYTIVGLQSLVAQWAGRLDIAAAFAEEAINELQDKQFIRMMRPSELNVLFGKWFTVENIFCLIDQDLKKKENLVHPIMGNTNSSNTSPIMYANYKWLGTNLYLTSSHGTSSDIRYKLGYWFEQEDKISSKPYKVVRYHSAETYTINSNPEVFEIKIVTLHRLLMVAAEHYASTNPQKAIDYLNKARNARDIITPIPYGLAESVIKDYVFDEVRKENIGEGILFSEYKRLYRPIQRSTNVAATLERFKLPIPTAEATYNP